MSDEQDERCCESVLTPGMWRAQRCSNKAGYGRNGCYCKLHAKRHPSGEEDTRTVWRAEMPFWREDKPKIVAKQLLHETAEQVTVLSDRGLGNTEKKKGEDYHYFDKREDAVDWLFLKLKHKEKDLLHNLRCISESMAHLEKIATRKRRRARK